MPLGPAHGPEDLALDHGHDAEAVELHRGVAGQHWRVEARVGLARGVDRLLQRHLRGDEDEANGPKTPTHPHTP